MDNTKSFIAWCKSVIRHAALNAIRDHKRYRERMLVHDVDMFHGSIVEWTSRDTFPDQREWAWMFELLSGRERIIIKLLYIHGYSQRETACLLHTTQQKISIAHRHAIETLREAWLG